MKKILLIIFTLILVTFPAEAQYWKKITSIPAPYHNNYWLDVYFLPGNALYGWICGFNGMVIRTTDSGQSWVGDTVPGAYHLESIMFPSTNIGYTSGVEGIWKSTNGGASWFSVKPIQAGDSIHFWGCYFYDNNNGVVIGEGCAGVRQYFWRTTNGGATWTYTTGNEFDSGLTDAMFLASGLWIATSSGKLWRSTDGGYNWSVFATSGTNLWQEEITNFGQSYLLPYAGDNCQGGGVNGGMRFTTNDGASWNDVNVGVPMFGSFLLSATEGWACGYDQAVYYTSNAGATWTLKNCGITPGNLDDIWFISNNVGWVVGQGVYEYSNATQFISKTMIDFIDGCLGSVRYDTLFVRNFNFNSTSANWLLQGNNPGDFRILEPNQNFTLPACDSTRFVIQFNPSSAGVKTADLRVDIPGYRTLLTGLTGTSIRATAAPSDTLIIIDSADCGKTLIKSVTWTATNTNEYINAFSKTGSNDINLNTSVPLQITRNGVETKFNILPSDTGWQSARFTFNMFPCNIDTFITVKFYGYSPIINSVNKIDIQGECEKYKDIEIPVWNTGNNNLIISNYQIMVPANGFSIIGWKSGKTQPRTILPKEFDTLIVRYQPVVPGTFSAKLRLSNNDLTRKRGTMNPYDIDLTGSLIYSDVQTKDTVIEMGEICVGDSILKRIKIWNGGNLPSNLNPVKNSLPEFTFLPLIQTYPIQIVQFDTLLADIKFKPKSTGLFIDTIVITAFPCNEVIKIILTGRGVSTKVSWSPQLLTGTVYNYSSAQSIVRLTNESSDDITVNSYNFNPPLTGWIVSVVPAMPFNIVAGGYQDVVFTFSTSQDSTLISKVCFDITGKCPVMTCLDVNYKSINDPISVEPDPLVFDSEKCNQYLQTKNITIHNLSTESTIVDTIYLSQSGSEFSIMNLPSLPYSISPLDSLLLNINFLPINEGIYSAELSVVCSLSTVKTNITGSFLQTKLTPSASNHSFGKFEFCENKVTKSFRFNNNGLLDDTVDVTFQSNINGFELDKNRIVIPSKDSAEISITFDPAIGQPGMNTAKVRLSSIVCSEVSTIDADAEIVSPAITITPLILRYDNVWIGDSLNSQVTFLNNSDIPVTIDEFTLSNAVNKYETDLIVPVNVAAYQSIIFNLRFIAEQSGSFIDTMLLNYSSVCDHDTAVLIYVNVPDEVYKLHFDIPAYTSLPYADFNFEVILVDSVYKFRPDSLNFDISYDPWLFSPETVHYLSNTTPIEMNAGFLPGIISINVPESYADTMFLTRGPKFRISGKTYPSSPNLTPLDMKNINLFSAKTIDVKVDDGSLEVIPVCHPTAAQHLILSGFVTMRIKKEIINDGNLEMAINSTLESNATIVIYSLNGTKITEQSAEFNRGDNTLNINLKDIPNGTYYFVFNSSTGQVLTRKFINIR